MSTSVDTSTRDQVQVQESLDNLRRDIRNSKDPVQQRQYHKMITLLLRRYGHLKVH